jgi:hypothetical protein
LFYRAIKALFKLKGNPNKGKLLTTVLGTTYESFELAQTKQISERNVQAGITVTVAKQHLKRWALAAPK